MKSHNTSKHCDALQLRDANRAIIRHSYFKHSSAYTRIHTHRQQLSRLMRPESQLNFPINRYWWEQKTTMPPVPNGSSHDFWSIADFFRFSSYAACTSTSIPNQVLSPLLTAASEIAARALCGSCGLKWSTKYRRLPAIARERALLVRARTCESSILWIFIEFLTRGFVIPEVHRLICIFLLRGRRYWCGWMVFCLLLRFLWLKMWLVSRWIPS